MDVKTEVFRLNTFDKTKCYGFALYTSKEGNDWKSQKYYTTNPIKYLGKWQSSDRWGYGDNSGGSEKFELGSIIYDYDGKTCFVEMPCNETMGGKRKSRRNRKSNKSKKGKYKKNRTKSNRRRR